MRQPRSQSWCFVRRFISLLALPIFFSAAFAQAGRVDYLFNLNLRTNSLSGKPMVNAIAIQSDGKTLIAGNFHMRRPAGRAHLVRLNTDDTVDATFDVDLGGPTGPYVDHIALQSDGKIVIAGFFWSVNGVNKRNMARLNPDGSVDTSFTPFLSGSIRYFKIQPDLKILAAVHIEYTRLVRMNPDGSQDTTFGAAPFFLIGSDRDLAVDSSNRIYQCGSGYRRLHTNGSEDTSFAVNVTLRGYDECGVTALSDGRLLIWGTITSVNGLSRNGLAMLNSNGSLVETFVSAISAPTAVADVEVQPDGKIIFVGYNDGPSELGRFFIGRLNADGSLDRTWHRGRGTSLAVYDNIGFPLISTIKIRGTDKLLVGGKFFRFDTVPRAGLAQLRL